MISMKSHVVVRMMTTQPYLRKPFDHLVAGTPVVVISRQPALWRVALPVLFHVVLTDRSLV
jgi:hypothetical protein